MTLHMVYRDHRTIPGRCESRCHAAADHQRPYEAGACRVRNGVRTRKIGLLERLGYQRQQAAHVIAGRNLGNHATVAGVQVHLAVQPVGQKPAFGAVDRDAGLVAAGFDAQNVHCAGIIHGPPSSENPPRKRCQI